MFIEAAREMISVDSPLETFTFNYVNFGILSVVNSCWTWIAVITAAVSFWRIRAINGRAFTSTVKLGNCSAVFNEIGVESEGETVHIDDFEPQSTASPAHETETMMEMAVCRLLTCNGVTKGKLTVYYEGDGKRDRDYGELTAISGGGNGEIGDWWERRGRVVTVMNREDGWYRYVDLTVINGNVVRLWDDNGIRYDGSVTVRRKLCCGW